MTVNKKITVNYSAREFATIKQELINHAKRYYPDSYQDFNEAGFGSLMMDTVAYVGDMLSFYLDYQANESFLETANERQNVLKLAKQMGYKHDTTVSTSGMAAFYVYVPADTDGVAPDPNYMPVLKKNSTFGSNSGNQFTLLEDVRFDRDDNEVAAGKLNENGIPTYFAIKSYGKVISGEYVRASISVGDYTKFLKVQVPLENVIEIISVTDSNGYEYYEVENLSQDFIYKPIANKTSTKKQVDNHLRAYYVPRRFVKESDNGTTYLQFGHGTEQSNLTDIDVADPSEVVLKYSAKNYITDSSFDPSRLVYNNNFGIVPENTVLNVLARVNQSGDSSIGANTLTEPLDIRLDFQNINNLDREVVSFMRRTFECNNEEAYVSSKVDTDNQQIKKLAFSSFSSQNRAVTKQDYQSLIYKMPKTFGAVKRVNVLRDQNSFRRNLNAYVVSQDENGYLSQCSSTLKENIKTWLSSNKMINDTIDIIDAKVINLGVNFQITTDARFSKEQTLAKSLSNVREHLSQIGEIGQPFFISDIYQILRDVDGVLDVVSVNITNKEGINYSQIPFDIEKQRSADGRYIDMPDNVIYEIKFPNQDIRGAVV